MHESNGSVRGTPWQARSGRGLVVLVLAALLMTVIGPVEAHAAATATGYLPFPAGTRVHVFQGNGSDPGCSTHCVQPDYYAWDFGASSGTSAGMPIVSATSGTVIGSRNTATATCTDFNSPCAFGNYVFVHNDDGSYLEYLHMQYGSVAVSPGQPVSIGQPIGRVGATGYTGGFPHLHLSWLTSASGTGDAPRVGNSAPAAFIGLGHPATGQDLTSNNPGADAARLLHTAVAVIPGDGASGYSVDGYGTIRRFGNAPAVSAGIGAGWPNWDIARGITLNSPHTGFVLDGYGGVHPFSPAGVTAPAAQSPGYTSGSDVFRGITEDTTTHTVIDIRAYNTDGTAGDTYSFHTN